MAMLTHIGLAQIERRLWVAGYSRGDRGRFPGIAS